MGRILRKSNDSITLSSSYDSLKSDPTAQCIQECLHVQQRISSETTIGQTRTTPATQSDRVTRAISWSSWTLPYTNHVIVRCISSWQTCVLLLVREKKKKKRHQRFDVKQRWFLRSIYHWERISVFREKCWISRVGANDANNRNG